MSALPPQLAALGQEWQTLQNNYEQYEKGALLIKLVASVTGIAALASGVAWPLAAALVALLWVQEGIFRTYQARLGERLLRIERMAQQSNADDTPFQLHSQWLASRRGMAGLLVEYATSTLKPTVAFPYAVLLLIICLANFANLRS